MKYLHDYNCADWVLEKLEKLVGSELYEWERRSMEHVLYQTMNKEIYGRGGCGSGSICSGSNRCVCRGWLRVENHKMKAVGEVL